MFFIEAVEGLRQFNYFSFRHCTYVNCDDGLFWMDVTRPL